MKSKEQAHLYLSSEDKEKALGEIAVDYCKEIVRLKEARNIKTDQALISVFDELDKKFRSFANIVNTKLPYTKPVKAHGFEMILESFSPKAFDYWIEGHNKNIKN